MRLPHPKRLLPSSHYALLALLFFVGLKLVYYTPRLIIPLTVTLLLLMGIGILLVRLEERDRFHIMHAVLPVLAVIGLMGFGLFLPPNLLNAYFIVASLVLFWILKNGAKVAYPTWNWTLSTIVFFVDAATILGFRFHLYIPVVAVLGLIMLTSFLILLPALQRITPRTSEATLNALAVSLTLTQIAWAIQFLPIHYVVQAGVLVAFYYAAFHLISISYERRLLASDITEYAVVGALALILILASARWT